MRSDWKGRGLGHALMRKMIDYARSKGIRELFGYVLRENETMLAMSRELGFTVTGSDEGPGVLRVVAQRSEAPAKRPSFSTATIRLTSIAVGYSRA